jgi:DNA-binding MarR family transcriptional regulator
LRADLPRPIIEAMVQSAIRRHPAVDSGSARLDRALGLLERTELSPTEMRVLLAVRDCREATIAELADLLETCPTEITRAGRRLAMRGLIRWHHSGRSEQALLGATAAGAATIEALLMALDDAPYAA